ncbi:8742_t:CDS:2 [Cetraspora pellucida]|uniref:8742_t:CDS:1 n=1 Tax=Cetraspora pellucida TaxID=1433469 RepID=A0A9N9JFX1_9GLOM|nr:8742_t:CDS:2 [Cetraspora pellucida]
MFKAREFSKLSKFKQRDILRELKSSLDDFKVGQEYYLRPSPQLYHHLLVKAEHDFINPGFEFFKSLRRIFVCNILWKPKEIESFFIALERCGKHNPAEISQRIGTKSVPQVMMLIELFEHELNLAKACEAICPVNYADIPSAREMSNDWLKFEKIQAEMIQDQMNKIETKLTFGKNMQPISQWDEKKLELFELENILKLIRKYTTEDILVNRASILMLYYILQNWLQGIVKNLVALKDHYQKMYIREKHEASLQISGYKFSKIHNPDDTDEDDDLTSDDFTDDIEEFQDTKDVANNKMIDYDNNIELKEQKLDELYEKAFLRLVYSTDTESAKISNEIENLEVLLDADLKRYNGVFDELSDEQ